MTALRRSPRALTGIVLFTAIAGCGSNEPVTQPQIMPGASPFVYPTALWDKRVTGETLLLLRVTAAGGVDSVTVFNSSGYQEFDSAAVEGARKLHFVPGRRGAVPIDLWTKLPVRFEPDSMKVGGSTPNL
jgi:TonB family protein